MDTRSVQSSNGGDEEFESHSLYILNIHSPSHLRPISTAPPPPPPPFDPFSNYLHNANTPWPAPVDPVIFQSPSAHRVVEAARNPRKRSRASRRAPTTVLTTDASNFRAMVQEFTGIPSPPFNNSSSFSRSRLDLFTASEARPYLLRRPFAQKAESPPPFLASSTVSTSSMSSSSSINVQLPNLFNVQNPINLTSLLQSYPKFLLSSSNDQENHDHHFSTTLINGLPNLVSPDQVGTDQKDDPSHNRNAESGYHQMKTTKTITGGGGGYSISPSGFRGGKGPENIVTRGEGMVDSWISSSD